MRYEDATNSPGSPFAIGVTLKELSVFTTDAQGNRKFVTDTRVQHKWLELKELALYHHVNCSERMPEGTSLAELTKWLAGMIENSSSGGGSSTRGGGSGVGASGGQYVISPMNIGARVAFRPEQAALAANQPRTKVDVQLSAVSLALCEQQLRDAARLAEYFMTTAGPNSQSNTAIAAIGILSTPSDQPALRLLLQKHGGLARCQECCTSGVGRAAGGLVRAF